MSKKAERIIGIEKKLRTVVVARTKDFASSYKVNVKTIQNDIEEMNELWGGESVIVYRNNKCCFVSREGLASMEKLLHKKKIAEDEANALLFYTALHYQYKNLTLSSKLSAALEKMLDTFVIRHEHIELFMQKKIISTEKRLFLKGNEHIPKIIQALKEQKKIKFIYTKFTGEKKERILSPFHLKEDRYLWYVIGIIEGHQKFSVFALDRMSQLEKLDENIDIKEFDSDNYFKYSMGITVLRDDLVKVRFLFTPIQANYVKATPIHETQKIISEKDGKLEIEIEVQTDSYEFYSKILSFGANLQILSPKDVKSELKKD